MKIYHLIIKDTDDAEYDMHLHFSHASKSGTELWEDYHTAYDDVITNIEEWTIQDVFNKMADMGWNPIDIEKVEVEY